MANYFVIGGDTKEYGPVTEADLRQWISEGRLNSESLVKGESDAEFRRLALFPEFAPVLTPSGSPVPAAAASFRLPGDFLDSDYELDIAGCISRGWAVYKENFVTLFVGLLIAFIIQGACGAMLSMPFSRLVLEAPPVVRVIYGGLNAIVLTFVTGPLWGGLFLVYLKCVRGETTGIAEVFTGFQRAYLQLVLGYMILSLMGFVCMLPFNWVFQIDVGPLLAQMQHMQNDPSGIQSLLSQLISKSTHTLPVLCICMVPMTFFGVCLQFTLPLIIDQGMAFGEAIKASWHMVLKHWWLVFGLSVVVGLISLAGLLGCCIGMIFTAPIGLAAVMCAYEDIFHAPKS